MKITKHPFSSREEFLAVRDMLHKEHRLGGSEVGTAAGLNEYESPRRMYERMIGRLPTPDISSKQAIKDGILGEENCARKFEERTGKKVHRVNSVMTSDAAPHLFASIDRKVEDEDAGLECKTASALNWDKFIGGKLPDHYVQQVKTYLKVTGWKRWYVYVWISHCAEYCYIYTTDITEIDNKPDYCDAMYYITPMDLDDTEETAANWFNNHIVPKMPPECNGHKDETAAIKELFPEAEQSKCVDILSITATELDRLDELKAKVKAAEQDIAAIENSLRDALGDASEGYVGERKITYRNNKPSTKVDWEAIARELNVTDEIIAAYTSIRPGARVLRISK